MRSFRAVNEAVLRAGAVRAQETELGTALFAPDTPQGYDANGLILRAEADAATIAARLDALYGGQVEHRRVWVFDDARGTALAGALGERGYGGERLVVLEWEGPAPQPDARAAEVEEAGWRAAGEREMREDGLGEETIAQLALMRLRSARGTGGRWFAVDDRAHCTTWRLGDTVLVGDLGTAASARGEGLATSVLALAVRAAFDAGAREVLIDTDADDWMAGFYRRFGFTRELGFTWSFLRPPP